MAARFYWAYDSDWTYTNMRPIQLLAETFCPIKEKGLMMLIMYSEKHRGPVCFDGW